MNSPHRSNPISNSPHRKSFEQLRHKSACSIDELKLRLRKLYVQDVKCKRERVLKDKRDIDICEEDELDFFKKYCRQFFGQYEDPWDVDEELLEQIWEEIQLEELENVEAGIINSLLDHNTCHQIVCPICLKLPAYFEEGCITCKCGLKFPLPQNMTLKDFEAALLTSNDLHGENCNSVPVYHVYSTEENTFQFISSCESCQTINTILETQLRTVSR